MNTSLYLDLRKNSPPRYPIGRTAHPADPIGRTAHPADPIGRTAHPALCQPLCLNQTRACFNGRRWPNDRYFLFKATWMKIWNSDHESLSYNRLGQSDEQPTQLTPSEEQPTQLTPSEEHPTWRAWVGCSSEDPKIQFLEFIFVISGSKYI